MSVRKIPYELKTDNDGLLYTDNFILLRQSPLNIDTRKYQEDKYYLNDFFPLYSTNDYIIKYCITRYTRKEIKALKEMLEVMTLKQSLIKKTDFPIGYFKHIRKLQGFIIPNYQDGMSYDHLLENADINEVKKYYHHDEDSIHNVFLMLLDVLDAINEMFDNGIYYSRFYSDDIVLHDNEAHLIDFDQFNVSFCEKDKKLISVMGYYLKLLNTTLKMFELSEGVSENLQNFEEAKTFTKKIENKVRKG